MRPLARAGTVLAYVSVTVALLYVLACWVLALRDAVGGGGPNP